MQTVLLKNGLPNIKRATFPLIICFLLSVFLASCGGKDGSTGTAAEGYTWSRQIVLPNNDAHLCVLDAEHVWAATYPCFLYFYNGSNWETLLEGKDGPPQDWTEYRTFHEAYATDATHIWLSGQAGERNEKYKDTPSYDIPTNEHATIFFYDGSTIVKQLETEDMFLEPLMGVSNNRILAEGKDNDYLYDGTSWTMISKEQGQALKNSMLEGKPEIPEAGEDFRNTIVVDAEHAWASKDNAIYFFNGSVWKKQYEIVNDMGEDSYPSWRVPVSVIELMAVDADHVWALTSNGIIYGAHRR